MVNFILIPGTFWDLDSDVELHGTAFLSHISYCFTSYADCESSRGKKASRISGMGWRKGVGATTALLVAAAGGLFAIDAFDVIEGFPGLVTMADPFPDPEPFPEIPGAVGVAPVAAIMGPLSSEAPLPAVETVQSLVNELIASPAMGPRVGVLVSDQLTGQRLGAAAPNQVFVPASTQKLLTGMAALAELDPEARLATVARLDGSRLILAGGGDMLLAAGHGNFRAVDEHAGMADLAELVAAQLRLVGRTTVSLSVDDTLFADPRIAAAVPPGEQRVFVAPVASVAVNQARTDGSKSDSAPRFANPALAAGEVFAARLAEQGITVEGRPSLSVGPTTTIPEIARVESATIGEIKAWAMQRSDNTITEVLGRLVAMELGIPPTASGAVEAVKRVVERLGVDLHGAELVDLSGLGRGSRLTPEQLNELLNISVSGPPYLRDLASQQPIGGMTGTLATRFTDNVAGTGAVRAKTGSLPGVTALSGTVQTAGGRLLLFTVLADETPGPGQWGARQAIDRFVNQLAALDAPAQQ
jgi:D-alanyl-D-alanine carboxypeptidase/D-alanyl-D-alanine-endopeptidase (penicillin-binding protein 4)